MNICLAVGNAAQGPRKGGDEQSLPGSAYAPPVSPSRISCGVASRSGWSLLGNAYLAGMPPVVMLYVTSNRQRCGEPSLRQHAKDVNRELCGANKLPTSEWGTCTCDYPDWRRL